MCDPVWLVAKGLRLAAMASALPAALLSLAMVGHSPAAMVGHGPAAPLCDAIEVFALRSATLGREHRAGSTWHSLDESTWQTIDETCRQAMSATGVERSRVIAQRTTALLGDGSSTVPTPAFASKAHRHQVSSYDEPRWQGAAIATTAADPRGLVGLGPAYSSVRTDPIHATSGLATEATGRATATVSADGNRKGGWGCELLSLQSDDVETEHDLHMAPVASYTCFGSEGSPPSTSTPSTISGVGSRHLPPCLQVVRPTLIGGLNIGNQNMRPYQLQRDPTKGEASTRGGGGEIAAKSRTNPAGRQSIEECASGARMMHIFTKAPVTTPATALGSSTTCISPHREATGQIPRTGLSDGATSTLLLELASRLQIAEATTGSPNIGSRNAGDIGHGDHGIVGTNGNGMLITGLSARGDQQPLTYLADRASAWVASAVSG